jgi:hypothetical protein
MRLMWLLLSITFAFMGVAPAAEPPQIGPRIGYSTAPVPGETIPYFNNEFSCGPSHPGAVCGTFGSAGRRPMLGISVVVPVSGALVLRTNPLYQRLSFDSYNITPSGVPDQLWTSTFVTTADRWEWPVSVAWNAGTHIRAGAGGTVSTITGANSVIIDNRPTFAGGGTTRYEMNTLSRRTIMGTTVDLEFPFRTSVGIVSPDIQYTRWLSRHYGARWALNRISVGLSIRFGN